MKLFQKHVTLSSHADVEKMELPCNIPFKRLYNFAGMKFQAILHLLITCLGCKLLFAQPLPSDKDKLVQDDPILAMLDSLQMARYFECNVDALDSCFILNPDYKPGFVPLFDELVIEARLAKLDSRSPFDLVYNQTVKHYIDLYSLRKRVLVSRVNGLSKIYFPLFEEQLARHNLPAELKYLAIVESALNPVAVSKSGATGLWQFMYPTGKMFGLEVTSYTDDRKDPIKATEAACRYFTYLYSMFNDWQLVLAAYNCGPGAVNKAIRRSGGIKTYWELRPYLPAETQGYVPAFIAVNYVMNHTREHNLPPVMPKQIYLYTDTVRVKQSVDFNAVCKLLDLSVEDICYLNPSYRLKRIPAYEGADMLRLPQAKVGTFINNEFSIYKYRSPAEMYEDSVRLGLITFQEIKQIHQVKKGEHLSGIARKYNCTVDDIRMWNKLKKNSVKPGSRLIVFVNKRNPTKDSGILSMQGDSHSADSISVAEQDKLYLQEETSITETTQESESGKSRKIGFHTIQKGDTLWNIANRYNMTSLDELLKLNSIDRHHKLIPGQKLKVTL